MQLLSAVFGWIAKKGPGVLQLPLHAPRTRRGRTWQQYNVACLAVQCCVLCAAFSCHLSLCLVVVHTRQCLLCRVWLLGRESTHQMGDNQGGGGATCRVCVSVPTDSTALTDAPPVDNKGSRRPLPAQCSTGAGLVGPCLPAHWHQCWGGCSTKCSSTQLTGPRVGAIDVCLRLGLLRWLGWVGLGWVG